MRDRGYLVSVTLTILLLFTGCEGGDEVPNRSVSGSLIGTWLDVGGSREQITFSSDGTYQADTGDQIVAGTWQIQRGILTRRCPSVFKAIFTGDSLRFEVVEPGCSFLAGCPFSGMGRTLNDSEWDDEFGLILRFNSEGGYVWGDAFEEGQWAMDGDNVRITVTNKSPYLVRGDILTIGSFRLEEEKSYRRLTE